MHVLAQEGGPINAVFGSFEDRALWVVLAISLVALLFAYYLVREVLAAPEGTEKMREIARAIQEGSRAYLNRQFRRSEERRVGKECRRLCRSRWSPYH